MYNLPICLMYMGICGIYLRLTSEQSKVGGWKCGKGSGAIKKIKIKPYIPASVPGQCSQHIIHTGSVHRSWGRIFKPPSNSFKYLIMPQSKTTQHALQLQNHGILSKHSNWWTGDSQYWDQQRRGDWDWLNDNFAIYILAHPFTGLVVHSHSLDVL